MDEPHYRTKHAHSDARFFGAGGRYVKKCVFFIISAVFFAMPCVAHPAAQPDAIRLNMRRQVLLRDALGRGSWQAAIHAEDVPASEIAIIIIDMWDRHWSRGAQARIEELAPRINAVIKKARDKGIQIVHAPRGCMQFYSGTPASERMDAYREPPAAARNFSTPLEGARGGKDPRSVFVAFDSDTESTDAFPAGTRVWTRQHSGIEIAQEQDVISDDGDAVYNFLRSKGVRYVAIMGVHTDRCVLTISPVSIKHMLERKMEPVLVRDMTDAMYSPEDPPYVNHDEGTQLVVEFIEKFWCPTIASTDLTGAPSAVSSMP